MDITSCIKAIKNTFADSLIRKCEEKGCKLRVNKLKHYVILKGEKICSNRKMCDCIIFTEKKNRIIIGIVELRSKTIHANEIKEKLDNGSKVAMNILERCCSSKLEFDFYHVVLSKKWKTSEYKVITNKNIDFKGKRYKILPKRCGCSFYEIIN